MKMRHGGSRARRRLPGFPRAKKEVAKVFEMVEIGVGNMVIMNYWKATLVK